MVDDVERQIAELVRRNLKITSCPVPVIREFKAYCDAECGGNYAVGLQQLLKTKQVYENLIPLISHTLEEVDVLKAQLSEPKTKRRRTLG
jgi:hypothetical protein